MLSADQKVKDCWLSIIDTVDLFRQYIDTFSEFGINGTYIEKCIVYIDIDHITTFDAHSTKMWNEYPA